MSIAEILAQASAALTIHSIPNPLLDAEVLLAHVLGLTRAGLYARLQASLSEADTAPFHQLLQRRLQREPLQYITGVQEFWSLAFAVNRDVLIPRPETELIVETSLQLLSQPLVVSSQQSVVSREEENQKSKGKRQKSKIENPSLDPRPRALDFGLQTPDAGRRTLRLLDVGTGSGCIAIALAKELLDAEIWATDISSTALAIAQENARRHDVTNRVHFLRGDLFAPLQAQELTFDLIVSNPPYIVHDDILTLQPEVGKWEPHEALDGGPDGLDFYRRLLTESPKYLCSDGWLIMEIGHGQGAAILQLAQQQPELTNSDCIRDYEGCERVITAQRL